MLIQVDVKLSFLAETFLSAWMV